MHTEAGTGRGAPSSDVWFDGSRVRTGDDDERKPSGTPIFGGGQAGPVVHAQYQPVTVREAKTTVERYGSQGGGVVLEGMATGLGTIDSLYYDKRFNAFILDNRAAYFLRMSPANLAVICRAFAQDTNQQALAGVSLGQTMEMIYGKLPRSSNLAWDLRMADHFLGDIAFASHDWTAGYRFARDYKPERDQSKAWNGCVYFQFQASQFEVAEDAVRLARVDFKVTLVPLSRQASPDGGFLPDFEAIPRGEIPAAYERNVRHIAENISYYRQERLIERMFTFAEVASFLRAVKREGFDLNALADTLTTKR